MYVYMYVLSGILILVFKYIQTAHVVRHVSTTGELVNTSFGFRDGSQQR